MTEGKQGAKCRVAAARTDPAADEGERGRREALFMTVLLSQSRDRGVPEARGFRSCEYDERSGEFIFTLEP